MKNIAKLALGAALLAGTALTATIATTAPAAARVSIGIGIGAPIYPGYYPPGPCYDYDYYYNGDCGYPVYYDPVYIGGYWYSGPHYYRYYNGRPWVWNRGHWYASYRGGWSGHSGHGGSWGHGGSHHGGWGHHH